MDSFDEDIEVLWGHYRDDSLGEEVKVSIIVTGFDNEVADCEDASMDNKEKVHAKKLRDKYYSNLTTKPNWVNTRNNTDTPHSDEGSGEDREVADTTYDDEGATKHPVCSICWIN